MNTKKIIKDRIDNLDDESELSEILNFMDNRKKLWKNKIGRYFFPISIVSAGVTLWYLKVNFRDNASLDNINSLDFILYGIWALLTPAWFLIEYNWIFPNHLKFDAHAKDDFKYTQELSNKFWVALLVIFSSILIAKYNAK